MKSFCIIILLSSHYIGLKIVEIQFWDSDITVQVFYYFFAFLLVLFIDTTKKYFYLCTDIDQGSLMPGFNIILPTELIIGQ